ncbi:MAG: HEAT repeat domain-containing protein [Desulfobulbus sp.]|nr:HEAT repeat domain-containing protein [Desulfobulbus sp.]
MVSSRTIKTEVLTLLRGQNLDSVTQALDHYPPKDVINVLFSAICREDPHIRWFAVSCMGRTVSRLADLEMEEARIVMRRFLWSLNDESGGIGWGAPESMAEVMCQHPGLAEEYVHMLISYMREDGEELYQDGNYLEHPLLQQGVLWGIARMSGCRPRLLIERGAGADIPAYLHAEDDTTRGLAVLAAGNLYLTATEGVLRTLVNDSASVTLYWEGTFQQTTVGTLAQAALERMADE